MLQDIGKRVVIRFQICIFDILNTAYCYIFVFQWSVVIRFQICIFDILNTAFCVGSSTPVGL